MKYTITDEDENTIAETDCAGEAEEWWEQGFNVWENI